MSGAYYNEIDPYCAEWLKNLIAAGHIAPGDVDTRSIEDVTPHDLRNYTQCHFFAGIGVWSHALRSAGWSDERPIWTGSCPCQPFSAAGKGGGFTDERHLWPAWHHLIAQCRPHVVFGEQVASKDGLTWLDLVHADLEATHYAVGAFDLCAAGVGAPHIRQRLYFVAHHHHRCEGSGLLQQRRLGPTWNSEARELGYTDNDGSWWHSRGLPGAQGSAERSVRSVADSAELASAVDTHTHTHTHTPRSFWSDCDWLPCTDGKARPAEPGTFPLAHGAAARVGRLRAYGNAVVAPLAQEFIEAYIKIERGFDLT